MNSGVLDAYERGKLILFAGAGLSMNLGLPPWKALIDHLAEELGYDPQIFSTYGDYLALAEYYTMTKGSIGPLRSWMDREWHDTAIDIAASEIHRLIAVGNFKRIYTTNFDRWLEKAHDHFLVPYDKIAKVADLVTAKDEGRQIVKFHGDFDDDQSIVLGETTFFDRLDFETPLDIKLRNDVLGSSVLFIGYSLADLDIRLLFHRLSKMWGAAMLSKVRPKSFVLTTRPNPVAQTVLAGWGIELIVLEGSDPGQALTDFMRELVEP